MKTPPNLFPPPKSIEDAQQSFSLPHHEMQGVRLPEGCQLDLIWALGHLQGKPWVRNIGENPLLVFELNPEVGGEQAYRLSIQKARIRIEAASERGWLYGAVTLNQWLDAQGTPNSVDCVLIEDAPKIHRRGYMLDVSRDRMPTMGEFRRVIDQLARLKYNHLELYLEHTFAYVGHAAVSDGASPITADEMSELIALAARRGIEMIPNQNTFGHMHRWLTLPEYNHLAEEPEGTLHAFDYRKEPFGLCAANPGSFELVDDMLGQLLPLFDSPYFNAGLDETFDLGRGGSAELCEEKGKGAVYMEYLCAVHEMTARRGKRMVFWADILLEHPEVFDQLPKGCVPVIWGYEHDHPLDAHAKILSDIGADFWIAPGTSSWQSLTGRASNCLENIRSAARAAIDHGASGLILTDWGDWGHWQPPSLSNLGVLQFAVQAWSGPDQADPDSHAINQVFYSGQEPTLAEAWMQLWQASEVLADGVLNGTSPFYAMRYPKHGLHPEGEWEKRCPGWSLEKAQAYDQRLRSVLDKLAALPTEHPDSEELQFLVQLAEWANARAKERGQERSTDPEADAELQSIEAEMARLWLTRSRPGGLSESLRKMRFALHPDGVGE
jgi:hexosaminidase